METLLEGGPQDDFRAALLAWYKRSGRHDHPWRNTNDPYAIVVSEFMLQQTTVATVLPYYDRFLKRFPTLKSLADAPLDEVLALWSGLGYYARARNLWSAMKAVAETHGGKIPPAAADLEKLPGIGPYTAGAISAFAFNKPAAVLDGNIIRVLMRLLAIEDDPKMKAVQAILRKVSYELSMQRSRDVNLALMDLGSTVCVPQNPRCDVCPGASLCLARAHGKQNDIPLRAEKAERPRVRKLYAVIERGGRWLVAQRPREGLFGGLWEFPGVEGPAAGEPIPALEAEVGREVGWPVRVKKALTAFEHHLTHRVFQVRPFLCEPAGKSAKAPTGPDSAGIYERFQWVAPADLESLGISAITKRIAAGLSGPQVSG
jgi:A/G-specific adenine glycosylase